MASSRQQSGNGGKFISLEIARFLAALAVALEHISTTIPGLKLGPALLTAPAPAAVLFFFTLSGFVIHNAHARDSGKPARLPRYVWRRFWRIYPLYWLSLIPMLAVLWNGCSRAYLVNILTLAPFTGNIAELNPPAWTLRYELLFYIIFGLALLPYIRRVLLPGWALLLAAAWGKVLLGFGPAASLLPFLPRGVADHLLSLNNVMFFAGLGASWVFARHKPPSYILWPLLGFTLLALAWALRLGGWGNLYPTPAHLPFTAATFGATIYSLAALEHGGHLRLTRRGAALGAMSYPLYLMHAVPGFLLSAWFFFHPAARAYYPAIPTFFLLLAASLALTAASAFLFDAPLQRFARKIL